MSFNADYYRKLHAQQKLSYHQVQSVLEELITELSLIQPSSPNTYMIHKLDEMKTNELNKATSTINETQNDNESNDNNLLKRDASAEMGKPANLSSLTTKRLLISVFGLDKTGKSSQCNAIKTLIQHHIHVLSPEKLIEEAILGGRGQDCNVEVYIAPDLQETVKTFVMNGLPLSADVITRLIHNKINQIESDVMCAEELEEYGKYVANSSNDEFYHYKQISIAAKRHENNKNNNKTKEVTTTMAQVKHKKNSSLPFIYILDGYPRTIEQAVKLHNDIGEVRAAVHLLCTPAVLKERKEAQRLLPAATANRSAAVNNKETEHIDNTNNKSEKLARSSGNNNNNDDDEQIDYLAEFWKAHHVYHAIDATSHDRRSIAKSIVNKILHQETQEETESR